MDARLDFDEARCEGIALHVADVADPAWKDLVTLLWPELSRLVRGSRSMGPFARSDDHVRDVVLRVLEKLGADGCRAVLLFPAWRDAGAGRTFGDWLRIVTANVVRDYVRERVGRSSGGRAEGTGATKRLLDSLPSALPAEDDLGERPPVTAVTTARELFEYANDRLPRPQVVALGAWLGGDGFAEIAAAQGLHGPGEASRLVRAALATLRRHAAE
jgi:hypothetical protein